VPQLPALGSASGPPNRYWQVNPDAPQLHRCASGEASWVRDVLYNHHDNGMNECTARQEDSDTEETGEGDGRQVERGGGVGGMKQEQREGVPRQAL